MPQGYPGSKRVNSRFHPMCVPNTMTTREEFLRHVSKREVFLASDVDKDSIQLQWLNVLSLEKLCRDALGGHRLIPHYLYKGGFLTPTYLLLWMNAPCFTTREALAIHRVLGDMYAQINEIRSRHYPYIKTLLDPALKVARTLDAKQGPL